ncbi:MAG: hypothetical protein WBE43_13425, partial [Candidatus Acidiferrales bacterium]
KLQKTKDRGNSNRHKWRISRFAGIATFGAFFRLCHIRRRKSKLFTLVCNSAMMLPLTTPIFEL